METVIDAAYLGDLAHASADIEDVEEAEFDDNVRRRRGRRRRHRKVR